MAKKGKTENLDTGNSDAQEPRKVRPGKLKKSRTGTGGGVKAFFTNHLEKIALGIVLMLVAFLIWDGWNVKKYSSDRSPETLSAQANDAIAKIKQDHWTEISEKRKIDSNFVKLFETSKGSTNPVPYGTQDWNSVPKNATEKRGDPALLAPKFLRGESVYGAIALSESTKYDPLKDLVPAAPIKIEPKGRPSPRGSRGGIDGSPPPGQPSGSSDPGYGMTGSNRRLNPIYDLGYRVTQSSMYSSSPYPSQVGTAAVIKKEEVAREVLMNVVTAAVPHEIVNSNYTKEFENAVEYQKLRDQPNYKGFEVQRVDITNSPNGEIPEAEWKSMEKASSKSILALRESSWAGECQEITKADWTHPKISMPIPPIYLRDYRKYSRHPKIPIEGEDDNGKPLVSGFIAGGFGGPGTYGGPVESEADFVAPPAYAFGGGGQGGSGPNDGAPANAQVVFNFVDEYKKEIPNTKYKLLRFYDFEVQPNHVYKYRVRLLVEDPNYPTKAHAAPKLSSLKPDAIARVQTLKNADEKVGPLERTSSLVTSWSEPSEPIQTLMPGQFYASEVKPASMEEVKVDQANTIVFESAQSHPSADVLYVEWDRARAVDVPRREDKDKKMSTINPGSVLLGGLQFQGKDRPFEIVHPITKVILADPKYRTNNPVTIIDIRGGTRLGKSSEPRDPLMSAGEVLALDPWSGQLVVAHEFDDFEPFRMYTYADEVEAATKAAQPTSASGR